MFTEVSDFEKFKVVAERNIGPEDQSPGLALLLAATGLTSEAGEFMQVLRKYYWEKCRGEMTLAEARRQCSEELADVMAYAAYAAQALNLSMCDLFAIYQEKRAARDKEMEGCDGNTEHTADSD